MKFQKIPAQFAIYEKELKSKIDSNDSPFLGLFADFFKETTKAELLKIIRGFPNSIEGFVQNFRLFPALLATLVTTRILEKFGESGYFEVYPYIESMIDSPLNQANKKELWLAYRKACLRLGLSVSPRTSGSHYIVEEFLRQAGLPLKFADRFCERAVKYANAVGVPDEDNPEEIKLWQQELVKTLTPPFPKSARRAIERDENCFYSRKFIRLFEQPGINKDSLSRLEKILLTTIVGGAKSTGKKARIPHIIFHDAEYGIILPGGEKDQWCIKSEWEETIYATHGEERFIPFDKNRLTYEVIIRNSSGISWKYSIWKGGENNRLLIFTQPSGKLVQSVSLADKEIAMEPGEYLLMLRFKPGNDDEIEYFHENPELFLKRIFLSPGECVRLTKGPAALTLTADQIPVLRWCMKPMQGILGNAFYPAMNLKLKIIIPQELKETGDDFFLSIKSPTLGHDIEVSLQFSEGNIMDLDLTPHVKQWKAGVARVLIELRKNQSGRSMVRSSIIIWNGLESFDKRSCFHCEYMPENIDSDRCENLLIDKKQNLLSYKDETNRFFKMFFIDGQRNLEFLWAVPGIFLSIVDYAGHDHIEKSIRTGSTVSVNTTSRKVLKIYAAEPAILHLGEFRTDINFARSGTKKIPLASLIEHIDPENNTLYMTTGDLTKPLPLIHLVSPFTAQKFNCVKDIGGQRIELWLTERIEGIRIIAENLLDGLCYQIEFHNEPMQQEFLLPGIPMKCFFPSENQLVLYSPDTRWPPGLWMINFHIKAAGRWGKLTNKHSQLYADGRITSSDEVFDRIDRAFNHPGLNKNQAKISVSFNNQEDVPISLNSTEEAVEIFQRIHNALIPRYAPQTWNQISWIEKIWTVICSKNISRLSDPGIFSKLLRLASEWPDESPREGEIPSLSLGAMLPGIFCLEKSLYSVKGEINNSLLSVFKFMPNLSNLKQVFYNNDLEVSALFGFSNATQVVKNHESPEKFSLTNYEMVLIYRDFPEKCYLLHDDHWIPGNGDFLGPIHYRYALVKFRGAFKNNLSISSLTRGKALAIVREFTSKSIHDYCKCRLFDAFVVKSNLGLFDEREINEEILTDEASIEREHFSRIIHFISLFASVCRLENREPGTLEAFMEDFNKSSCLNSKECHKALGYLLFVGEALFAFYLLLWELVITADYSYYNLVRRSNV